MDGVMQSSPEYGSFPRIFISSLAWRPQISQVSDNPHVIVCLSVCAVPNTVETNSECNILHASFCRFFLLLVFSVRRYSLPNWCKIAPSRYILHGRSRRKAAH